MKKINSSDNKFYYCFFRLLLFADDAPEAVQKIISQQKFPGAEKVEIMGQRKKDIRI